MYRSTRSLGQLSHRPCQENPTPLEGSRQSIQPAWWATSAEQGGLSYTYSSWWYVQVCTCTYQHTYGIYKYVLVCAGIYEYVLACTSTCWYVLVHTSMYYKYFLLLEYSDTNWNMPGCPFWYTVIPPCILLSSSGYEAVQGGTRQWNLVQGGTRQYQKVPYPWIWRYEAVQGLVPSCTSLYLHIQGYGTFWYCLVPPCTKFHCLVPPCTASYPEEDKRIQGCMTENQNGRNMLVCTRHTRTC